MSVIRRNKSEMDRSQENLENTIQKVGEMSNFSLGLKGKLIGKALINESLLICIRCCQKNVKGNVFNIVDEKKWGSIPPLISRQSWYPLLLQLCTYKMGEFISEVLFFIADLEFHKIFWGITHNKWWTSTRIRQPCIIGKNTLVSWHFSFEWSIPTPNTCLIQFDFIWPSFNKISLSDAYLLESTESREEGSMQFALNYITLLFLELLIVNSWIVCLLVC